MKKIYRKIFLIAALLALVYLLLHSNALLRHLFPDKVWAHKVNSIEKLHRAIEDFEGVELDVVYYEGNDGGFFDVNHPPDVSMNLSLKEYFQSQTNNLDFKYWIDFKNLNHNNELSSLEKLDSICSSLDIDKSNIIVESINPERLPSFKNKGFRTAFYLPSNLSALDPQELETEIEKIEQIISLYENTYISADYKDYQIIRKHFPERKKLLWFTTYGTMNKIKARITLYKVLMDSKVDVLLLPYHD